MNFIESVYTLSESFMKDPQYVLVENETIDNVAKEIKKFERPKFPLPNINDVYRASVLELVAASINYCYWYGKYNIRPNNASSSSMYNLLLKAFEGYIDPTIRTSFSVSIEQYIKYLALERFPMLEERINHLRELKEYAEEFTIDVYRSHEIISEHMEKLLTLFPGFASDMFLKRASLYFIQLFRRFGWFKNDLHSFFVPADYQIPKMLNFFGCISYVDELQFMIENHNLIPKYSQIECEIRAATILTIKMLCEKTGWNVAEIDAYFFLNRHATEDPFHLTITTDY